MPWFLYHAFKQLFPTGRWFPFFTVLLSLFIALGVALMFVAASIMGGFGYEIRWMIVNTQGEIQIVSRTGTIADSDVVLEKIRSVPDVAAATPAAFGAVGLLFRDRPAFPELQGVDRSSVGDVFDLNRYMVHGSLDDLDDDSVILSGQLARDIGARVGDEVELYSPLLIKRLSADEIMLPQRLRVAGIFAIGHQQFDRSIVICTLRRMQDLYGLETQVHRINVKLRPGRNEFRVAKAMDDSGELPAGLRALTWFESNEDFQNVVRFEKYMVVLMVGVIVLVAALATMGALLINVVRKTREIGLLSALGAHPRGVAASFSVQGFVLGILGTAGGFFFGSVFLAFREQIAGVLIPLTVGRDAYLRFYQFVNLPSHTETFDVILIASFSIVLSTIAGLIPAWRAARLKPVEALRSE